jgi:hypothetical protein
MEKTFGDVVWVFLVIDMLMMAAMFARPHEDGVFERGRAENYCKEANGQPRAKGRVREESMIAEGNAKARGREHYGRNGEVKPIEAKVP